MKETGYRQKWTMLFIAAMVSFGILLTLAGCKSMPTSEGYRRESERNVVVVHEGDVLLRPDGSEKTLFEGAIVQAEYFNLLLKCENFASDEGYRP